VDACMGLEEMHFMCTMPFTKASDTITFLFFISESFFGRNHFANC
jgi:hypothetical protein